MQLGVDLEQAILIDFALTSLELDYPELMQKTFNKEAIDDLKKQLGIIIQILK